MMRSTRLLGLACLSLLLLFPSHAFSNLTEELHRLSSVDRLPEYLITGARCAQESSYDRGGGNDDSATGEHSVLAKENGKFVIADLKGPGTIYRFWSGSTPSSDTIEFYFDGEKEPRIKLPYIDLYSGKAYPFVEPLCGYELGGYYCYLPIPYAKSCKILYCGPEVHYFQLQYTQWPDSKPVESFPRELNDDQRRALADLSKLWKGGILPIKGEILAPDCSLETMRNSVVLHPGETKTIASIQHGGRIVALAFSPALVLEGMTRNIVLTATWDDEKVPAIHCPLADFFGFAYGERSVRSFLLGTNGETCYCLFPMPFDKSAELKLSYCVDSSTKPSSLMSPNPPVALDMLLLYDKKNTRRSNEGKFYAHWSREEPPEGQPHTILDVAGRGHYVGCILQSQGLRPGKTWFFEGDDVAVIDGEMRIHGTGSEDFFNGGLYSEVNRWDTRINLPLSGSLGYSHPFHRTGGYRLNLLDKVAYEKSLNLTIERGDDERNAIPVDFSSVAFYYADRAPKKVEPIELAKLRVPVPDKLEYIPKLQPIYALSLKSTVSYTAWAESNDINDVDEEDLIDNYTFIPHDSESHLTLMLEIQEEGNYEVQLSYLTGPRCGRFQVCHRTHPLSEVIDSFSKEIAVVHRKPIGTVHFSAGSATLTFMGKGRSGQSQGNEVRIYRIFLQRVHNTAAK